MHIEIIHIHNSYPKLAKQMLYTISTVAIDSAEKKNTV